MIKIRQIQLVNFDDKIITFPQIFSMKKMAIRGPVQISIESVAQIQEGIERILFNKKNVQLKRNISNHTSVKSYMNRTFTSKSKSSQHVYSPRNKKSSIKLQNKFNTSKKKDEKINMIAQSNKILLQDKNKSQLKDINNQDKPMAPKIISNPQKSIANDAFRIWGVQANPHVKSQNQKRDINQPEKIEKGDSKDQDHYYKYKLRSWEQFLINKYQNKVKDVPLKVEQLKKKYKNLDQRLNQIKLTKMNKGQEKQFNEKRYLYITKLTNKKRILNQYERYSPLTKLMRINQDLKRKSSLSEHLTKKQLKKIKNKIKTERDFVF